MTTRKKKKFDNFIILHNKEQKLYTQHMVQIEWVKQEGMLSSWLLHTLCCTRAQLIPIYRHRKHLPLEPSLVVILEIAAQIDLLS